MEVIRKFYNKFKHHEVLLFLLLVFYILLDIKTPKQLAKFIDTILGKTIVLLIVLAVFSTSNPIISILTLIAGIELIRRSMNSTGTKAMYKYLPTQDKKDKNLNAMNQFPPTLEEEVVSTMAPLVNEGPTSNSDFLPILANDYFAAPVDYNGVV